MVWSMTGYGRAQQMLHGREITVEMRSVNARYLEYAARLPRNCAFLEEPVKKLVAAQFIQEIRLSGETAEVIWNI